MITFSLSLIIDLCLMKLILIKALEMKQENHVSVIHIYHGTCDQNKTHVKLS
jgi:hypothetical protein